MEGHFADIAKEIERIETHHFYGRVTSVRGLLLECSGLERAVSIGSRCKVETRNERMVLAEVVGFKNEITLLMPFTELDGVGMGCKVWLAQDESVVYPCESWKGRIVNAMGEPLDGKGPLPCGTVGYPFRNSPPPANARQRVAGKIDLGIRAINTFLTCCKGQRMGVFSGSGVGKSMLISMLTRYCQADVKVVGLIGERGREVQEFIQDYLGEEGLQNAVVIIATGDESALMRRQAAYLTLTVSEYFRDLGKDVLCIMDSVTRFAMAQREIGLSAGEPPTTKGYTPTVFAELPKLLERAGPGEKNGTVTGIFSVLVEGDDHNEPIADAVRAILDGHIVLERSIAERGRYPAINILRSVSRTMPRCNSDVENQMVNRAKQLLAAYNDMAELIRLGAYKNGSNAQVDEAIKYHGAIENFLNQKPEERSDLASGYRTLANILGIKVDAA